MAAGNKHLGYKEALNVIEERSPGTKAAFYAGFLERAAEVVAPATGRESLHPCPRCGAPTTAATCAFCRLVERTSRAGQPRIPVKAT